MENNKDNILKDKETKKANIEKRKKIIERILLPTQIFCGLSGILVPISSKQNLPLWVGIIGIVFLGLLGVLILLTGILSYIFGKKISKIQLEIIELSKDSNHENKDKSWTFKYYDKLRKIKTIGFIFSPLALASGILMAIFGGIYCEKIDGPNPTSISQETIPFIVLLVFGVLIAIFGFFWLLLSAFGTKVLEMDYEGSTILVYAAEKNLLIIDNVIQDKKIFGQTFNGALPNGSPITVIVDMSGNYFTVIKG